MRSAIEQRDRLDSTRSAAPLRQADDADLIDTTGLDGATPSRTASSRSPSARGGIRAMRRARPKVAVIGYPNVGKSTLVNRLSGTREAVTDAQPGVTRDRKDVPGGVERRGVHARRHRRRGPDATASRSRARCRTRRASRSRTRTRCCSWSTRPRGCAPATPSWRELLRRSPVPSIVAANKLDRGEDAPLAAEFHGLGLGEPVPVSAAHGIGTGDLLDTLVDAGARARADPEEPDDDAVSVAVIGRPNVGKSSLVNAFLGQERVIVDERAGTTRDAIDTRIEVDGRPVVLVDTAGLRRVPKVAGTVDYYAQLRSERAAERADVALVVCDAQDGVTVRGPAHRRPRDAQRLRHDRRAEQVGRDGHRPRGREGARRDASCACARA